MEMTKQRKMLIGVLCVGLAGLGVDRFVIGSPDSANAEDEVVEVVAQAPLAKKPAAEETSTVRAEGVATKTLPSYASLTERLIAAQNQHAGLFETQGREDPFSLPTQWHLDKSKAPMPAVDNAHAKRQLRITSLFTLDGTVRSLINGREEMLAVISGAGLDSRAIRVGQKIKVPYADGSSEEYELVEVGSRYVIWKSLSNGEQIKMQVDKVL